MTKQATRSLSSSSFFFFLLLLLVLIVIVVSFPANADGRTLRHPLPSFRSLLGSLRVHDHPAPAPALEIPEAATTSPSPKHDARYLPVLKPPQRPAPEPPAEESQQRRLAVVASVAASSAIAVAAAVLAFIRCRGRARKNPAGSTVISFDPDMELFSVVGAADKAEQCVVVDVDVSNGNTTCVSSSLLQEDEPPHRPAHRQSLSGGYSDHEQPLHEKASVRSDVDDDGESSFYSACCCHTMSGYDSDHSDARLMSASPPRRVLRPSTAAAAVGAAALVVKTAPPPPPPPPPPPRPPFRLSRVPAKHAVADGTPAPLPRPKLKPLHWDKVRVAPNRSMVWDKIRFRSSNSFEFDELMMESLFAYTSKTLPRCEDVAATSGCGATSCGSVMDHKRLQNATILMKALDASADQVCRALENGAGLSLQQLEVLVKMTPTKEEEEKLAAQGGDAATELLVIDPAERFIRAALTVPFAFERANAMLYCAVFDDEVSLIRQSFATINEACSELVSSPLLLRLLETVLNTGNRMNVGTVRGSARAFKLDALLKLADVRGADGKTTLLHFVAHEMTRLHGGQGGARPWMSDLAAELAGVRKAASVDFDTVVASASGLSAGLSRVKLLLEDLSPSDEFASTMAPFVQKAEGAVDKLRRDADDVRRRACDVEEYYHGEGGKGGENPLEIFVIVSEFLGVLERACKETTTTTSSSRNGRPWQELARARVTG